MLIEFQRVNEKGFGIGYTEDGKLVECIGVLPQETAEVEIWGKKKGTLRANLVNIVTAIPERISPEEEAYESTAPLAIVSPKYEATWKMAWIHEQFNKHHITCPDFSLVQGEQEYGYRNKVEFGFYSDEAGLHLAFHKRNSSKGKLIVQGTLLAIPQMNQVAQTILQFLRSKGLASRDMKSLIVRSTTEGKVVAAIFCKERDKAPEDKELQELLNETLVGIIWVYSDYRAPDSRITEIQRTLGELELTEIIDGKSLSYPWHGFFQVNPIVFSRTIQDIRDYITTISNHKELRVVDLYAGVGTIGLCVADLVGSVHGVEVSEESKHFATKNADTNSIDNYTFDQLKSEDLPMEQLHGADIVIVDPPRSGLMPQVVDKILLTKPEYILYVSCNPATQARDLVRITELYSLEEYTAYNYYPRTMHVEGLAVLKRK